MSASDHNRRDILAALAAASSLAVPAGAAAQGAAPAGDIPASARAQALIAKNAVIDMLSPITLTLTPENYARRLTDKERADFRRSGVTAIHHAAGWSDPDAYTKVLTIFAGWNGFIARNSDVFMGYAAPQDFDTAKTLGKIAVIMGVQNSEHFRTTDDVHTFYQLGQRVSLMTYNSQNRIGSGSTDSEDGGISLYGQSIIREMNKIGMLVDVSHSGDHTTLDGINYSAKPIAIGHSNCRALSGHVRAKTDEAIKALGARGGVMGISAVRPFVKSSDPTTVDDVVAHIDHVAQLIGGAHVGLGTDADLYGYDAMDPKLLQSIKDNEGPKYHFRDRVDIEGTDRPTKYYAIADALIRKGYSDAAIAGVLGGNFRRLFDTISVSMPGPGLREALP